MRKRWLMLWSVFGVLALGGYGYVYGVKAPKDLARFPECHACGMSRQSCSKTRTVVEYADGTKGAECGLHCLVADLVDQPGREPKRILVADYVDKHLVEAQKAWWVRYENEVGCRGGKVMLAFAKEKDAASFVASYGGRKLSYDDALQLAYRDNDAERGGRAGH